MCKNVSMLPDDLTETYRRYLASVVRFHLAAAEAGGLGPTDYQASSLLDLDGPMAVQDLAEELGLSPSATTRVVDRLVQAGIASRTTDSQDRRRTLIAHTGHLPAELHQVLGGVRGAIGAAVATLDAKQVEGLATYFSAATRAYQDAAPARRA